MLVVAPTNHFTCGGFHSITFCHGVNQCRLRASFSQKATGSFAAASYSARSRTTAPALKFGGGGNSRSSLRRSSKTWVSARAMVPPSGSERLVVQFKGASVSGSNLRGRYSEKGLGMHERPGELL